MTLTERLSLFVDRCCAAFGVHDGYRRTKMPHGWAVSKKDGGRVGVGATIQGAIVDYHAQCRPKYKRVGPRPAITIPPPEVVEKTKPPVTERSAALGKQFNTTGQLRRSVRPRKPAEPPKGSTPTPPPTGPSDA